MKSAPRPMPLLLRLAQGAAALLLPVLALSQAPSGSAPAGSPGEVYRRMAADSWIPRNVNLSDLGFKDPVVLGYPDSLREFYLPVPPNVSLANATLQLDASYVRSDGGRTSMVVSVDGVPLASRAITLEKGDASLTIPIDPKPRPSGFIRVTIDWRTAVARENTCADSRTPGNLLRIEPSSRFTYRYDGSGVRDLSTAWSALPSKPTILIAGSKLSSQSYDSAWRVGVALERAGKRPIIKTLPAIGDTIDLAGATVPAALRGVPAYAAFGDGGPHKIKDAAELGALIAMGQYGPLQADVVVLDAATTAAMNEPLEALRAQIQAASPDAVAPFGEWRARGLDSSAKATNPGEVRLASVYGRPAIIVSADAGAKAAGLFTQIWQQAAAGSTLVVQSADEPKGKGNSVTLKYLGAKPSTFDVLAQADWNATFDIGSVAADGKGPSTLVIDVAAAPSAAHTPPIVSVLLNDVLLGAMELKATGQRERIIAPVPRFVLAARNVIRVSFVRQLASDRCRETPEAYPVSVLSSSHMLLDKIEAGGDFSGLMARFADGGNVYVPAAYLGDSQTTLPRVIRLAATTGVSPSKAKLTTVADGSPLKADGPFLAIDLPPADAKKSEIKIDGGRLYLAGDSDKPLLDVTGVNGIGILEVTQSGGETGATYRTLGAGSAAMDKPMALSDGNVAILGENGLRSEINTHDPSGLGLMRETRQTFWERTWWWILPLVLVAFFLALLVYASRMRRSKTGDL